MIGETLKGDNSFGRVFLEAPNTGKTVWHEELNYVRESLVAKVFWPAFTFCLRWEIPPCATRLCARSR
jgi:hypothetical protein